MGCLALAILALTGGLGAADKAEPASAEPALNYTVSWLGNTFAEPNKWVQMDAAAMFVAPTARSTSTSSGEEGGRNAGIYKDGQCVGNAGHTHGWGYEGGEAVTANDKYLFIAQHVSNEGGGLKSPNTWPPKGKGWTGVSRRFRDGKPAPFEGGKGGDGDTLKGCFLPINEFDEKAPVAITGMAATNEQLCIADASGNIQTFDPSTMAKTGEFDAPGARQIAFAPDGSLWVIQGGGASASAEDRALLGKRRTPPADNLRNRRADGAGLRYQGATAHRRQRPRPAGQDI